MAADEQTVADELNAWAEGTDNPPRWNIRGPFDGFSLGGLNITNPGGNAATEIALIVIGAAILVTLLWRTKF